jgi:hypothetical protein
MADWNNDLLERIATALELPKPTGDSQYPLVIFDVVGVEKLQEEPELDGQCLGHVSRIRL